MIFLLLICLVFFPPVYAEETDQELKLAKPLPLIPGDPLTLSPALEKKFYQTSESKRNYEIFKTRQFPFEKVLFVLLVMGCLPWFVKRSILKSRAEQKTYHKIYTFEELLTRLNQLKEEKDSKEKIDALSEVLRRSFSKTLNYPTENLTFEEIYWRLQRIKPPPPLNWMEINAKFKEIESLQFRPNPPEENEWDSVQKYVYNYIKGESTK